MSGRNKQRQLERIREQRISVRTVRREAVDLHKISRAIIAMAQADVERQAQADQKARKEDGTEKPDAA